MLDKSDLHHDIAMFLSKRYSYLKRDIIPQHRWELFLYDAVCLANEVPAISAIPDMIEALQAIKTAATTPALPDGKGKDLTVESALSLVDRALSKIEKT